MRGCIIKTNSQLGKGGSAMKKGMFFAIIAAAVVMVLSTSGLSFAGGTLKVTAESHPNTEVRTYHTNKVVTEAIIEDFRGKKDTFSTSERTVKLINKLFEVPGVSRITLTDRYEISIHKGEVFNWKKMQPEIIWALKNHFGAKKLVVKEKSPSN